MAPLSYKQHAITARYDAIVIGSGMGGLTAAAILAKNADQRVLVLERHYTAGGLTQSFTRPGWDWDVGVHYVGEVGPSGALRKPFDALTGGRLAWAPLPDIYDRIFVGDRTYDIVAGRARFVASLKARFPHEATAIDRWVALVEGCRQSAAAYFTSKALPSALSRALSPSLATSFLEHASRTTWDVVTSLTNDRELAAVLTGQFGNYGLPPMQSSFAVHAGIVGHFMEGAYFPVGGAGAIAEAFAPTIEAAGGAIFVNAEVAAILVEGGRARGVRMTDGRELRAPIVISDAGVAVTYGRLLRDQPTAAPDLRPSLGHICIYLGFEETDAELGLDGTNLWIYPDEKHDENLARFLDDPDAPVPFVYASFPSAKDPAFRDRHPGRATIDVLAGARYEWFAPWADRPWRRRGADYEALKESLADRMLEIFFAKLPHLRNKVAYREVSTPITTAHFTGHPHGEMCGLDHTPQRFAKTPGPRTDIPGLFLTGQDVALVGVGGAFTSGALAASAIEGPAVLRNIVWSE